jgi:hypothetical protein
MRNASVAMVSAAALGLVGIETVAFAQDTFAKTHAHKYNRIAQTADLPSVSGLDARATAQAPQSTNSGCRVIQYLVPNAEPQYTPQYTAVCGPE